MINIKLKLNENLKLEFLYFHASNVVSSTLENVQLIGSWVIKFGSDKITCHGKCLMTWWCFLFLLWKRQKIVVKDTNGSVECVPTIILFCVNNFYSLNDTLALFGSQSKCFLPAIVFHWLHLPEHRVILSLVDDKLILVELLFIFFLLF